MYTKVLELSEFREGRWISQLKSLNGVGAIWQLEPTSHGTCQELQPFILCPMKHWLNSPRASDVTKRAIIQIIAKLLMSLPFGDLSRRAASYRKSHGQRPVTACDSPYSMSNGEIQFGPDSNFPNAESLLTEVTIWLG